MQFNELIIHHRSHVVVPFRRLLLDQVFSDESLAIELPLNEQRA